MQRQVGQPYYDPLNTRREYQASMLDGLRQIYSDEDRMFNLEQTIYNRTQPREYIECATNLETLRRVLARKILPDLRNRANATIPANGVISPAQAIDYSLIPVG